MDELLISADSHVTVHHDQVKERLAATFHEDYDEATASFQRRVMNAPAGAANQSMMQTFSHPAFGRAGNADPHERLVDMDTDGVQTEVLYCEVSAYRFLYRIRRGWQEATHAFNNTLRDFASVDPKRLVVSYQIPIHDIEFAASEVRRVAESGGKSLQLPVFPTELDLPDYFDERYDPLWAAVQETGLPICLHIGLKTGLEDLAERDPTPQKALMATMTGLSSGEAIGMWLLGGTLEKFPRLKVVFVEAGLLWVAWFLNSLDDKVVRRGYRYPAISELPSFYFHRNVHLTYIDEPDAVQLLRHRIGVENIMWSSDYPHPVSSWPHSRAMVEKSLAGVPADERELIVSGNAGRVWNL